MGKKRRGAGARRMEVRSSVCALKLCWAMAGFRRACCGEDVTLQIVTQAVRGLGHHVECMSPLVEWV